MSYLPKLVFQLTQKAWEKFFSIQKRSHFKKALETVTPSNSCYWTRALFPSENENASLCCFSLTGEWICSSVGPGIRTLNGKPWLVNKKWSVWLVDHSIGGMPPSSHSTLQVQHDIRGPQAFSS